MESRIHAQMCISRVIGFKEGERVQKVNSSKNTSHSKFCVKGGTLLL